MIDRLAKRASLLLRAFATWLRLSAAITWVSWRAFALRRWRATHIAALARGRCGPTLVNHKSRDCQKDQNKNTNQQHFFL